MNRRKLLQALPALAAAPVLVAGKEVGKSLTIDPAKKYLVFIDPEMININEFCMGCGLPAGTWIHAVYTSPNKSIDEAIRIYEVES